MWHFGLLLWPRGESLGLRMHFARKLSLALFQAFALALAVLAMSTPWGARADAQKSSVASNITLGDSVVFTFPDSVAGDGTEERARTATQRLAEAAARAEPGVVHWETHGEDVVVLLGMTPLITLHPLDAEAAREPSLAALAQRVAASVQAAVERERERAAVAHGVFSGSLVVFLGLVCLYLGRRLGEWCRMGRVYLAARGRDMPALRLRELEVLGPMALRGGLLVLLGFARWFGAIGLAYTWLVVSLSMFDGTRPYVERVTGVVLQPLSALAARVATSLPVLAVVVLAGLLVAVLMRTIELFFSSISKGDAEVEWLSAAAAPAISVLARAGLVIGAAVFVVPVLTGYDHGPLSISALLAIAALCLSATPLLASLLTGLGLVLSHRLRVGDRVQFGGQHGHLVEVGVFCITLQDDDGAIVRVPHLMGLWHATRIYPRGES
jgi:hypothetical protein